MFSSIGHYVDDSIITFSEVFHRVVLYNRACAQQKYQKIEIEIDREKNFLKCKKGFGIGFSQFHFDYMMGIELVVAVWCGTGFSAEIAHNRK